MSDDQRSVEDQWQDESLTAVHKFGEALTGLHQSNPWPGIPLLPSAINHLMTELWDRGFSRSEIRDAFESAVADLPRYSADNEVRP